MSALFAIAEPIDIYFLWRPQLVDPADEMVLEVTINGRADGLVTFNIRDFGTAPDQFGFPLLKPQAALRRMQQ